MPYKEEPTLQELIAGSIDEKKKKSARVKVVRSSLKENIQEKETPNSADEEIGEEFIDRSQFKNYSRSGYDAATDLDPEFMQSLRENFGNNLGTQPKAKKQEFQLNIKNNEFEDLPYSDGESVKATVKKIPPSNSSGSKAKADYSSGKSKSSKNNKKSKSKNSNSKEKNKMKNRERFDEYTREDYEEEYGRNVKPKKKKHIFLKILGILLLLGVIALGFVYLAISKYADLFNYVPTEDRLDIADVVSDENVFNILLIGTDVRNDNSYGLSDSMILVSINKETDQIVLSSFMRDMYVEIPGQETETWHKLNWAHSKGGPELLMDTLEYNFGVEIDYYAKVDFTSFAKIIDSAGGLDIEITDAEAEAMIKPMAEQNNIFSNEKGTDYLYEGGLYHMNGNQALAYARIRKGVGDDFARTERQREVLTLLSEKVKEMGLKELDEFAQVVIPEISTNMEKQMVKKLMASLPFLAKYEIVSQRIPYGDNGESWNYGSSDSDGSIIVADFDLNKKLLMETIYNQ